MHLLSYFIIYTVFQKNYTVFIFAITFLFVNQFFLIFGKNVAKEIGNMWSLTRLLLTVQMSYS